MLNDTIVAYIRTYVPIGVGLALTWLATELGVVIDASASAAVTGLAVAVSSAAWYALGRWLERYRGLRWMLGVPRKPTYPSR